MSVDAMVDDMKQRRERVRASLRAHVEQAGVSAGLVAALEWLEYLARWDTDAAFPFPADAYGNPTADSAAWVDWSVASDVRETLEAAAGVLREIGTTSQA